MLMRNLQAFVTCLKCVCKYAEYMHVVCRYVWLVCIPQRWFACVSSIHMCD